MAVVQIDSSIGSAADNPSVTADMTGANFIWVVAVRYTGGPGYSISDSESNTYHAAGSEFIHTAGVFGCKLFYAYNATVDSSVTVVNTATSTFGSVIVGWASGVKSSSDPYNGDIVGVSDFTTSTSQDFVPGALTVAAGDLSLTGLGSYVDQPNAWLIGPLGYVFDEQYAGAFGTSFGAAAGHFVNTGASASKSPTWSPGSNVANVCGFHATFAAAPSAGGSPWYAYAQQRSRPRIPRWLRSGILTPTPAFGQKAA